MKKGKRKMNKNITKTIIFPFLSEEYRINNCHLSRYVGQKDDTANAKKEHFHNFFEVHFIENGSVTYKVENETVTISDGEYLLLADGTVHQKIEDDCDYSYHLTFQPIGSAYSMPSLNGYKVGRMTDKMLYALRTVATHYEGYNREPSLDISSQLLQLIYGISKLEANQNAQHLPTKQDSRLAYAKQYINDNIFRKISCSDVAAHCYLSPRQCSRIFQKYEGVTLKEYIDRERLLLAETLLTGGNMTIQEISERLGFCNEYYFHTFFKKLSGVTPSEYKHILK